MNAQKFVNIPKQSNYARSNVETPHLSYLTGVIYFISLTFVYTYQMNCCTYKDRQYTKMQQHSLGGGYFSDYLQVYW